jgi:hypothetical protein
MNVHTPHPYETATRKEEEKEEKEVHQRLSTRRWGEEMVNVFEN